MWKWTLDWDGTYPSPCDNCANLSASNARVMRDGSWINGANMLGAAFRNAVPPLHRDRPLGFRCARTQQ
jgi:formylglycine-generating enzyme